MFFTRMVINTPLWQRLGVWTGFLGYRCYRTLSYCWERWLFELHPTILALNLAHYPGWKRRTSAAWMVLPEYYQHCHLAAIKLSVERQYNSYRIRFFTVFFLFVLVTLSTRSSICRLQEVTCPLAVFSGLDVPFLKLNLKCITVAMFFMEVRDLHDIVCH